MKCPQCKLKNLDHVKICIKCGYLLVEPELPEDFSPEVPRAGQLKYLKIFYWRLRRSRPVTLPEDGYQAKISLWEKMFNQQEFVPGSFWAMVLSLLVPGAGQFLLKRQLRGIIFMSLSLLTLVTFSLAMYHYLINILYTSASIYITLQSIAVCDVTPRVRFRRTPDLLVNISLAGLVWLGCYLATNQLMGVANNYFWPATELRTLMYNYPATSIIQRNDTVLIQRQQHYSRGNILVYDSSVPYIYDRNIRWNNNYTAINKVIGLPGETVKVKDGIIFINSIKLENQSELTLIKSNIPDMQWTLSTDEYFIINTNIRIRRTYLPLIATTRRVSVINIKAIIGRIVRIVSPFQRRKSL